MVIAPELLSYYASIPISRLEQEVAHIVASTHASTVRYTDAGLDQRIIRPSVRSFGSDQPIARTDYQAIVYQQARHDEVYGKLYYEDMPLRYRGHMLRDAQEVLPIMDGRLDNDTHQL